jgi:hypothetical protein
LSFCLNVFYIGKEIFMHDEERRKEKSIRLTLLLLVIVVLLALVLSACGDGDAPDQTGPTEALAASLHGNTYDLGKGPNTWCSRCHSPLNWDPASFPGISPNCIACKFPFDPAVREVESMDFVEEADWANITCENCHELEDGISNGEMAWLDVSTMTYVDVNTSTELCEMCHNNAPTFMGGGEVAQAGASHKIEILGTAHSLVGYSLGDRPRYCADCHDPHSTEPAMCEDCHDVASSDTHILGKNFHLGFVTCMACHDSSGADVGPHPDEDNDFWVTSVTSMGRGGPSTDVVVSHSITRAVSCDRCHSEGNKNGLTEYTAEGEIPTVAICKDGVDVTVEKPDLGEEGEVDVDYTLGACPEE